MTQKLVRGEQACKTAANTAPDGSVLLCVDCHENVHRRIEAEPETPGIQSEAVGQLIDYLGAAILNTNPLTILPPSTTGIPPQKG